MLHLASRSPRRHALLARLGVPFSAVDLDVPELRAPGETPDGYVARVALDKARAGLEKAATDDPQAWVLGADTEVVLDDRVYGKPADGAGAREMLASLAGRTHRVVTALALVGHGRELTGRVVSEVGFASMSPAQIDDYVATGEPMGKAGAYAIQGVAGCFVRHLDGSYSGVMGLPLYETAELLRRAGFTVPGPDAGAKGR